MKLPLLREGWFVEVSCVRRGLYPLQWNVVLSDGAQTWSAHHLESEMAARAWLALTLSRVDGAL